MCGRLFLHRPHNKRCMRDCMAEHKYAIRTRNCDQPVARQFSQLHDVNDSLTSVREAFWIHRRRFESPESKKGTLISPFLHDFLFVCVWSHRCFKWNIYVYFSFFFLLSIVLLYWLPCLPFWGSSDCLPFPGDIIYRRGHTLSFACWALMKTSLDQNMLAFFIDLATTIKHFNTYIPSPFCLYYHLYLTFM